MVRCLTLMEPWATLVAMGHKTIETRAWPTAYRGVVYIHAGKSRECVAPDFVADLLGRAGIPGAIPVDYAWPHLGKVVAKARLSDCVRTAPVRESISAKERALGDYSDGRFAFALEEVVPLREPVPAKGMLGLWGPMESLVAAVEARAVRAAPAAVAPRDPPPGAPPVPPEMAMDALAWARDCGMKDPMEHVGTAYSPIGGGWSVTVQESLGPQRIGTARYDSEGKRSMWTMDTKGAVL